MAKNPKVYKTLREHIKTQFPAGVRSWSYERVKNILYLDYVIQETLRLKPSVPGGLARVTPSEGLYVDDVFIPGDTIVSVPTYTIQRDPRYWDEPLEFKPERWEGLTTEKVPWIPFSRGQWSCPGKQLAFTELKIALSRIALQYDMAISYPDEACAFNKGVKDTFTLTLLPLHVKFIEAEDIA